MAVTIALGKVIITVIVVLIVGDYELINMGTKSKEQVQFDN